MLDTALLVGVLALTLTSSLPATMIRFINQSEGLRPSDSPTRSLAGPREPHSARVGSLARSFATPLLGFETAFNHCEIRVQCTMKNSVSFSRLTTLHRRRPLESISPLVEALNLVEPCRT
jgi:hypothetical protein